MVSLNSLLKDTELTPSPNDIKNSKRLGVSTMLETIYGSTPSLDNGDEDGFC